MVDYPSEEVQKEFYDADTYKRHLNRRLRVIHLYLTAYLVAKAGCIKDVLDVGCGVGLTSQFLIQSEGLKFNVVGIDLSKKHIERCNEFGPGGTFIVANFVNVDLPGNPVFDFIMLFDVLEHIPKPQHLKVFEQIKKYSHSKTSVGIIIPDPIYQDEIKRLNPEMLQPVDESIYPEDIDPLITKFGMKKVEEFKYDNYVRYLLEYKDE